MKHTLLVGLCWSVSTACMGQNLLGIATSPNGGTNRLYLNPAFAADSPYRLYLNVLSGNAHANNNYVRYQAPFSLVRLLSGSVPSQYKRPDGTLEFAVDYTDEILDGKPKNGTVWGEVRGPSVLMKVGNRGGLGITTRLRAAAQVVGASEALLSAVRVGLSDGALYGIPANDNQFGANTNTYSELGLTYAGTIWENDGERLFLGATAKVLLGYNAQHFINRGLNYQLVADQTAPNGVALEVNRLDATLAYTSIQRNRNLSPRTLFSPSPGRGVGLDIGLNYVSQADPDSPTWRMGAAVTDIGSVRYNGTQYTYGDAEGELQGVRFRTDDFNNIQNRSQILETIQQRLNTGRSPDQNRFRAGLPTSLNLTADYQSPDGLGIAVTYLQDLRAEAAMGVHQPSLVAVTPRFDVYAVGIAVPVVYLNRGLTAGLSVRVGPAFLGTDNLLGLIGNERNGIRPRGLDVYGGLAFGFGRAEEE
ncbi:DUF5723 family protein [Fibrisoma limi]|nr:DUF5723 family protein [Fibrisoma limi]